MKSVLRSNRIIMLFVFCVLMLLLMLCSAPVYADDTALQAAPENAVPVADGEFSVHGMMAAEDFSEDETALPSAGGIAKARAAAYEQGDYQLVYETEKVTLPDIPVIQYAPTEDGSFQLYYYTGDPVTFEFYNSTTQKIEGYFTSHMGVFTDSEGTPHATQLISGAELIRGHNYMISAYETQFVIATSNRHQYIRLTESGQMPEDIKESGEIWDMFLIGKLASPQKDKTTGKRVRCKIPVYLTEDGTVETILSYADGVDVKLTSPLETIVTTSNVVTNEYGQNVAQIDVDLIEDCNYVVQIMSAYGPDGTEYGIEPFPLTVKDHSESGLPKSFYNHFSCASVQGICLIEKIMEHYDDTVMRSPSGKTSVTGTNFQNSIETDTEHYFINDRRIDKSTIKGLENSDCEVFAVEAINMYRTEISRLAAGNYTVTREIPDWRKVTRVCYVDDSGALNDLEFKQDGGKVEYVTHTLSMYPTAIIYEGDRSQQMGTDGTALGPGASAEVAEKAILAVGAKSDKDPAGSVFGKLRLHSKKQTKKSITLRWSKVGGAVKYVIYGSKCGKGSRMKKITSVKGTSYTAKKAGGSKIKAGKYYKFIVVALDKNNNVVSTSKIAHAVTKGGKAGNHSKVTTKAKKNRVSLKKGKTFKLRAKQILASKKHKVSKHRALSYESSDPGVASVNGKGTIKAKKKGKCVVYAYTQSGTFAKVTVTVK
ncbi:MAG: hypothetical protein E7220_07080 [Clostridiales bacterium]|nr:hypothetical protein [Clostridiales bacterium]